MALDNTRKTLQQFDGEQEEDLYTDQQVNGGPRGMLVHDDESPRSLSRVTLGRASPPASMIHSITTVSPRSSSPSLSAREDGRISTIAMMSPPECDLELARRPCEASAFNSMPSLGLQAEARPLYRREAADHCSCLQSSVLCLRLCAECNILHDIACPAFRHCRTANHHIDLPTNVPEEMDHSGAAAPQVGGHGMGDISPHEAGLSSLALHEDPEPSLKPFALHECCDLARPDPRILCFDCRVFHSEPCRLKDICQSVHQVEPMGVCACGKTCHRKPIVLCRYCGKEYCTHCWYRNPLKCACGQTFDQSSSV